MEKLPLMEIEGEKEDWECPQIGEYLDKGISKKIPKGTKLKVPVTICFSDEGVREVEALVDTGAEINVIHPRLVPEGMFVPSKRPLKLGMANSACLKGGRREVPMILRVRGVDLDTKKAWN